MIASFKRLRCNFSSHVPSFVSMFHRNSHENKEGIRRLPSAPSSAHNTTLNSTSTSLPVQEIFRRSGHWSHRGDVAGGDSGIINNTFSFLNSKQLLHDMESNKN